MLKKEIKPEPNVLYLHTCDVCGEAWNFVFKQRRCPECGFKNQPGDINFQAVKSIKVKTDNAGRVIAHLAKREIS